MQFSSFPMGSPVPKKTDEAFRNNKKRNEGLGYFARWDEDDLIEFLELFEVKDLCKLALLSKAFYEYATHEPLWKTLCIRHNVSKDKVGKFFFKGSWRRTTLCPKAHKCSKYKKEEVVAQPGVVSPYLYVRWYRGNIPIQAFNITYVDVDKRDNLSLQEFIDKYERFNRPVIIRGAMEKWKSFTIWHKDNILTKYGNTLFKTNGTDDAGRTFKLTLTEYMAYAQNNHDEKPIYLFDNKFMERAPDMLKEYEVPEYFKYDIFDYMDPEDRPDYRWILVGGPRSGSPMHQDPHRTSAWNALYCGRKRWTLYPPDVIPPGVDEDLIDSEYYAAPDVMKWFLNHYSKLKPNQRPMEVVQEPGEIIFVPSGWWHQVLNLEASVAVTQNFCNPQNFNFVYTDMIERGSKSLKKAFVDVVAKHHPDLLANFPEHVGKATKLMKKGSDSDSDSDSSSSSSSSSDSDE